MATTVVLDKSWDPSLVVLGVLLWLVTNYCTLCVATEVRHIHARQRFERVTRVPYVMQGLAALILSVGNWATQLVLFLAVSMEDAEVGFAPGLIAASVLAPLPLALGALVTLALASRDVHCVNVSVDSTAAGSGGPASVGSVASRGLPGRLSEAVDVVAQGWRLVNYAALVASAAAWCASLVVTHYILAQAMDVARASSSHRAGGAVGGAIGCCAVLALCVWLVCVLPEVPGKRHLVCVVLTGACCIFFFPTMGALEYEVDADTYEPVMRLRPWEGHYLLGAAAVCAYNVVNVFALLLSSALARRPLHDNQLLGVGFGLATCLALDFGYGSRWLQLPVVICAALFVAAALFVSGIGENTALGYAVGAGYAIGPYLADGWTGAIAGLIGAAVIFLAVRGCLQGFTWGVEYWQLEKERRRKERTQDGKRGAGG